MPLPAKDPGFHRAEVLFRHNREDGNPNEPDCIVMDHVTGMFVRLDVDALRSLLPSITNFLKAIDEAQ